MSLNKLLSARGLAGVRAMPPYMAAAALYLFPSAAHRPASGIYAALAEWQGTGLTPPDPGSFDLSTWVEVRILRAAPPALGSWKSSISFYHVAGEADLQGR